MLINGELKYKNGALNGKIAGNATVELIGPDSQVMESTISRGNIGIFKLESAEFGITYKLRITPIASLLGIKGVKSGYPIRTTETFNLISQTKEMVIDLPYYTYKPSKPEPIDNTGITIKVQIRKAKEVYNRIIVETLITDGKEKVFFNVNLPKKYGTDKKFLLQEIKDQYHIRKKNLKVEENERKDLVSDNEV